MITILVWTASKGSSSFEFIRRVLSIHTNPCQALCHDWTAPSTKSEWCKIAMKRDRFTNKNYSISTFWRNPESECNFPHSYWSVESMTFSTWKLVFSSMWVVLFLETSFLPLLCLFEVYASTFRNEWLGVVYARFPFFFLRLTQHTSISDQKTASPHENN